MKKIISTIFCLVLFAVFTLNTVALERTNIYSNRADAYAGSYIDIPLYIENNKGMMGFKINVTYSTDAFDLDYVVPSKKLSEAQGNFLTNNKDGNLAIVWTDTENAIFDGELIVIRLNVKEDASNGGYTIGVNHSQEDTFNEKWEKLEWRCSDIIINIRGEDTFEELIPPKEENDLTVEDMDKVITDSLTEIGAESVDDLTDEQVEDFVANAENHIKYNGGKIEVSDDMTPQEKVDEILSAYPDDWNGKVPDLKDNTPIIVAVFVAIPLGAMAIVIIALYIRKRKNKGEIGNEKQC